MLTGLRADIQLAIRRLSGAPGFTLFAVLSLSLGLGVVTAVYSIVSSLLWPPLGVQDPTRLIFVVTPEPGGAARWQSVMSGPDFADFQETESGLFNVAASEPFYQPLVTQAVSEIVNGEAVTGEYFSTARVATFLGRPLQVQDDVRAAAVAVVSHRYWRTSLASDPSVIGKPIEIGGQHFEIVGVLSRLFDGVRPQYGTHTSVWIPARSKSLLTERAQQPVARERATLTIIGRLEPGRTSAEVTSRLVTIGARLDAEFPLTSVNAHDGRPSQLKRHWMARSAAEVGTRASLRRLGAVIVVLATLLLVVACTNLANLVLARSALRRREFAVRTALGASRVRLIRTQCVESSVVAILGGIGGLATASVLVRLLIDLVPVSPDLITQIDPGVSMRALLIAGSALIASLFIFGIEPALKATGNENINNELVSDAAVIGAPRPVRQRRLLRWQVAISVCFFLIVAMFSGVLATEVQSKDRVPIERLGVATLDFRVLGWPEARAKHTLQSTLDRINQRSEVDRAAAYSGSGARMPLASLTPLPSGSTHSMYMLSVTPGIFDVLTIPVVSGRTFATNDDERTPLTIVLSEKTARTVFGGADVVGKQATLRTGDALVGRVGTVVGVVKDTDFGDVFRHDDDLVYVPYAQQYAAAMTIVSRSTGHPDGTVRSVQQSIRQTDPHMSIVGSGPGPRVLAGRSMATRFVALSAAALGGLTLLMGMIGLYGLQSEGVSRRTREIGIRMAIGARADQIWSMVLLEGFRPVFEGLFLGLFFGTVTRLMVRAVLVAPISVLDPVSLGLVPIPFLMAAFFACYLPAHRASRVEPNVSLRHL
jgi:predicted permease